jgi:predicted PurR-regulated permease PerM
MAPAAEYHILVQRSGSPALKLIVQADTHDMLEKALREQSPGLSFPLCFHDPEFDEWCLLTQHAFESCPRALRVRPRDEIDDGRPASLTRQRSSSSVEGRRERPASLSLDEQASRMPRSSISDGGGAALRAVRERSMSMTAIFLEDRLKTISMAVVLLVAVGFLAWYLQDILKLVLVAGLMAVVLEPVVNFLSVRPEAPAAWTRRLRSCPPCACLASCCPDTASMLGALLDFLSTLRLPRVLAILTTLVLVLAVGTLLVVLMWNTVYDFVGRFDVYAAAWERALAEFKRTWKASPAASYLDIDTLLGALDQSHLIDIGLLQNLFVNSVAVAGSLIMQLVLVCIIWIFLVMKPPIADPSAASGVGEMPGSPSRLPGASRLGPQGVGTLRPIDLTRLYLRWKAAISLGKALACGLIYALLQIPLWPLFSVLIFWLNWVPVFGGVVAVILPLPLGLVDPNLSWAGFAVLFFLPLLVQVVVDNLIDQLVMARAMVLHPVTIMGGLFTARAMWGVTGMVLSVPALSLYLPCTFPVPSLYLPCTFW